MVSKPKDETTDLVDYMADAPKERPYSAAITPAHRDALLAAGYDPALVGAPAE